MAGVARHPEKVPGNSLHLTRRLDTKESKGLIENIRLPGQRFRVPTLIVRARGDPFIPFESFQHPAIVGNRSFTLMGPEHGGHCGFFERLTGPTWLERRIMAQLTAAAAPGASRAAPEAGVGGSG